jgi:signal transduction histidine kinase
MLRVTLVFYLIFAAAWPAFSQLKRDSLENIIALNKRDAVHAENLYKLGILLERSEPRQAIAYYHACLALSETVPGSWQGGSSYRLAYLLASQGLFDSVAFYYAKAEAYLEANPDDLKTLQGYLTNKGIFYRDRGQYAEALENYRKVEELGEAVIGKDNLAGNYLNMSNVYGSMGNAEKRQEYIFKALEIFETLQNKHGLAFCYNILGNMFYEQKQYAKALGYYEKSLEKRVILKDRQGEAACLGNIGNIYMDTQELDKALATQQKAMEINESLKLPHAVAINLINIGKVYQKKDEPDRALSAFQQAQVLLKKANITMHDPFLNAEIGRILSIKNDKAGAMHNLLLAIEEARNANDKYSELNAWEFLREFHEKESNFEAAYHAQKIAIGLRDSLEGEAVKVKLANMESRYELSLKETEIALLKSNQELSQTEIARQKANIQLLVAVFLFSIVVGGLIYNRSQVLGKTKRALEVEKLRNAIARDLHDDLGSTLSSIHIISQMAQKKAHEQEKGMFKKISHQCAGMMEKLSDIVWSIHPNNDTLEQMLVKMREFAAEILEPQQIAYTFTVSPDIHAVRLDLEKRRNVFLIFKEAVNNAAKYSQCDRITIELSLKGHQLLLHIKDSGCGFNGEEVRKGNGLNNMQERARSIGATLLIDSAPTNGTDVLLQAPISH